MAFIAARPYAECFDSAGLQHVSTGRVGANLDPNPARRIPFAKVGRSGRDPHELILDWVVCPDSGASHSIAPRYAIDSWPTDDQEF